MLFGYLIKVVMEPLEKIVFTHAQQTAKMGSVTPLLVTVKVVPQDIRVTDVTKVCFKLKRIILCVLDFKNKKQLSKLNNKKRSRKLASFVFIIVILYNKRSHFFFVVNEITFFH